MFDIGSSELLLIIVVAIVVIGPKDLPRALYKLGQVIGKAKGMARHFRTGVDAMIREAELEELQKQWAKENERIMAATQIADTSSEMKPLADEGVEQLPAPESGITDTVPAPETPPFQTDPGPVSDPDQPALPLEAPKGSSAA
jgi:sec-independent protein translocase protein TatB